MNIRMGRVFTLLAALAMATSATAFAADDSQSPQTGRASTAQDKAAEAKRLAKQAAALAQQAAALAAESQAASAPAATSETKEPTNHSQRWTSRDAAEVRISDAKNQPSSAGANASGWRGHQQSSDIQIRFKDDKTAAAAAEQISTDASSDLGVQLVSRTIADRDVRTANEQEPMPAPAPAHGANGGKYGNNGGNGCNSCNGDSGCNSCGGGNNGCDMGCCSPAPCLFWTAGVEATFLNPNLKDNGATVEVTDTATNRDCFFTTDDHGLDGLYVAPRIWLGVESCCWGIDVKYWQMRAQNGGADPSIGQGGLWDGPDCAVPDIGKFSNNSLDLYTLDLEVSRRLCLRDCWMQFSMGVRHAEIRHDESITFNSNINDTPLIGYARDNSFTQGTGLVFGWYGRRPLFPCSCVNWFYNLHYSVLWGPTDTAAETAAQIIVNDPGVAGSTNGARTHVDDTLMIGEVQLGLEWDYALQCLPANAFFRAALEYQRWDGGNGSSSATSFAGTSTTVNNVITDQVLGTATASTGEPRLDLFGFTLGTGLTW